MNPKSGTAGTAVEPAEPAEALEADVADPGEVEEIKAEQRETESGKYGAEKLASHRPEAAKEEGRKDWIEIVLHTDKGEPVAGEPYKVILPDGATAAEGTLDEKGFARIEGVDPGSCTVSFPRRDQSAWMPK